MMGIIFDAVTLFSALISAVTSAHGLRITTISWIMSKSAPDTIGGGFKPASYTENNASFTLSDISKNRLSIS